MAASRMVIRNPLIMAVNAAEIATTSMMRNALRKRSSGRGAITRHDRLRLAVRQSPPACQATLAVVCALVLFACGDSQPSTSPTAAAGPAPVVHVLVVTHTAGFRHSSIPDGEATVAELGRQSGVFDVSYAR